MTNKRVKIKLIIGIIAAVLLGILCWVLLMHPELFDPSSWTHDTVVTVDVNHYFYEADFSKRLEDDEDYETYLGYDRYVHYTDGALTVAVEDSDISSLGDDVVFFKNYFDIIISGDCEEYNKLFTEEYYETHEEKEAFTPQMLYDINIEKLSVTTENQVTVYAYDVSYKIFKNNGTFRDDIYSDASKTIYFEITDSEGELKINAVKYYVVE